MPAKLIPFERPPVATADSAGAPRDAASGVPPPQVSPAQDAQNRATRFACPRCGLENSADAFFCVACHQILIHRCPNCWHEQRTGPICENCGANMPLYWEVALEKTMEEENRLWWARLWAAAAWLAQIMMLPFGSAFGVARGLALRLIASRWRSR